MGAWRPLICQSASNTGLSLVDESLSAQAVTGQSRGLRYLDTLHTHWPVSQARAGWRDQTQTPGPHQGRIIAQGRKLSQGFG